MENVRVCVRSRPLIPLEKSSNATICTSFPEGEKQIILGKDRPFTFDFALDESTTQSEIYNKCVRDLIDGLFNGYNCTVFAYGQTGGGKTYTMGTHDGVNIAQEDNGELNMNDSLSIDDSELNQGVIPRAINHIFETINSLKANNNKVTTIIKASFLEIYRENVRDLLNPNTKEKDINIRQDNGGEILVVGVEEVEVTNENQMFELLKKGTINRTTGSTNMNEQSSRSHAIFTIFLEMRKVTENGEDDYIYSKLHLVDLAGSERAKKTGAVGGRFVESVRINEGLLALSKVISALGDTKKRGTHVPYRESKLTRLLQDSLGGNSNTLMIACISPADDNFAETLNTLKYANQARNIKNTPVINHDPVAATISRLRDEVTLLHEQLSKYKGQNNVRASANEISLNAIVSLKNDDKFKKLQQENNSLTTKCIVLESAYHSYRENIRDVTTTIESWLRLRRREIPRDLQKGMIEILQKMNIIKKETEGDDFIQFANNRPLTAPQMGSNNRQIDDNKPEFGGKMNKKNFDRDLITASLLDYSLIHEDITSNVNSEEIIKQLESNLAQAKQRNAELEEDLYEAKEDLVRDEEIFAAKMVELSNLQEHSNIIREEAENARSNVLRLEDIIHDLSSRNQDLINQISEIKSNKLQNNIIPSNNKSSEVVAVHHNNVINNSFDEDMVKFQDTEDSYAINTLQNFPSICIQPLSNGNSNQQVTLLEEMKQKLENEISQLQIQNKLLSEHHASQLNEYKDKQAKQSSKINELNINIKQKEELIRNLVHDNNETNSLVEAHKERVVDLENEVLRCKVAVEAAEKAMEEQDRYGAAIEEQIRQDYELKIRQADEAINRLKQTQEEGKKLNSLMELEDEIEKLKKEKITAQKKLKEEEKREKGRLEGIEKQLAAAKREADTRLKKISDLESINEKQALMLKKKMDKITVLKRIALDKKAGINISSSLGNIQPTSNVVSKESLLTFDQLINEILLHKNIQEKFSCINNKREKTISEKAQCEDERGPLEMRKLRSSISLKSKLEIIKNRIKLIDEKSSKIRQSDPLDGNSMNDLNDLQYQRDNLLKEVEELQEQPLLNFDDNEKLTQLDERMEDLSAAINFQSSNIKEVLLMNASKNFLDPNSPWKKINDFILNKDSLNELPSYLLYAVEQIINSKMQNENEKGLLEQCKMIIRDKSNDIVILEKALKHYENKYNQLETTYKESLNKVMMKENNSETNNNNMKKSMNSDEKVLNLLKEDNIYYKQTNRDLKKKIADAQKQISFITEERNEVKFELENMKKFVRNIPESSVIVNSLRLKERKV